MAKAKRALAVADTAVTAPASSPSKAAVVPASSVPTTRVPPPSKGELRAQIEKLETANAILKAKGREANRVAKADARRIAELERQVAQFQEMAASAVDPAVETERLEAGIASLKAKGREANHAANLAQRRIVELEARVEQLQAEAAKPATLAAPAAKVKSTRLGRPPSRKKVADPGDAVPPGVGVEEPEPVNPEAETKHDVL